MFLDSRREGKIVLTSMVVSITRVNMLLIFSRIKVSFVTVVPKYLNFAAFKDLLAIFMSCFFPAEEITTYT
jgi:hypothetical protein